MNDFWRKTVAKLELSEYRVFSQEKLGALPPPKYNFNVWIPTFGKVGTHAISQTH